MTTSTKAILVAFAIGVASATPMDAATIYVANNGTDGPTCGKGPKKPCRSISQGLDVAVDGDTIEVGPGRYGDIDADGQFASPGDEWAQIRDGCECMIHVNKAVVLVSRSGATQTLIHPGAADRSGTYTDIGFASLVRIDAAGAVFGEKDHGFTVASQPPAEGVDGLNGIHVTELAAAVSIGGNFVMMNERGILSSAPGLVVSDNLIQTNHIGLKLEGAVGAIISDNGIQGNNVGLGLLGMDAVMSGNIVTGNRGLGLTVHAGTGNTVSGNSVLGNGIGVKIGNAAEAAVHGNNIFGNDTVAVPTQNAGLISNASADVDASGNYFGVPTTSTFPGDQIYNLGTGNLATTPSAKARFIVALEPMK